VKQRAAGKSAAWWLRSPQALQDELGVSGSGLSHAEARAAQAPRPQRVPRSTRAFARRPIPAEIALLHVLTFGEGDLLQLAVDADLDGYRLRGLHGADAGQEDRHVFLRDGGRHDRDGRGLRSLGLFRGVGSVQHNANRDDRQYRRDHASHEQDFSPPWPNERSHGPPCVDPGHPPQPDRSKPQGFNAFDAQRKRKFGGLPLRI
jgi:hypothetical protein